MRVRRAPTTVCPYYGGGGALVAVKGFCEIGDLQHRKWNWMAFSGTAPARAECYHSLSPCKGCFSVAADLSVGAVSQRLVFEGGKEPTLVRRDMTKKDPRAFHGF